MSENSVAFQDLIVQRPSIDDRVCTAYSLANLAILSGANVAQNEIDSLATQAVNNGQGSIGLTVDATKAFLTRHGLEYVYLGEELSRSADDQTTFLRTLIQRLSEAPISFSLSSALTARPNPQSPTGFTDTGTTGTSHQVLAVREGPNVRIIDPYAPNSRLYTFNTSNMAEMGELLVTLTSSRGQRDVTSGPITRDTVKEATRRALRGTDSAKFIRGALSMQSIYTVKKRPA